MKTVYRVVLGDPIQRRIIGRNEFLSDPKSAIMDMFPLIQAAEEMYHSPIEWDENQNFVFGSNRIQILKGHLLCNKTQDPFYLEVQTKKVPESFVCGEVFKSTLTEEQETMKENLSTLLLKMDNGDIQIV